MAAEPYFRTVRDDEVVVGIEEIAYVNIVPVVAPKGRGDEISTTYLKVSDLLGYQQISQPTQVSTILRYSSVMFAFAQNGATFKVHEHNAQFAIMFQIPTAGTIFIFYINNGAIAIDGNANSLQCELDPNGSSLFYMTINPL